MSMSKEEAKKILYENAPFGQLIEPAVIRSMLEFAQQEAIAFAEWMRDNQYMPNSIINKDGHFWFKQYTSPDKRELLTTEQLYNLYKLNNQQP